MIARPKHGVDYRLGRATYAHYYQLVAHNVLLSGLTNQSTA